jgi:threonine dehydrogenase-like Zn-dependent dehydrogenase
MFASRIVAPSKVEVVEVSAPAMKSGHVRVKMEVSTLCGSDVHVYKTTRSKKEYPLAVGYSGHECVGIVEDSDSEDFVAGDVVLFVPHNLDDFTGFIEYLVVPPKNLLKLPLGIPLEQLAVGQQLGTVVNCCRKLPNPLDMDVVVLGQGAAGLLFTALLNNMGARSIIAIDLVADRLQVAKQLGAIEVIDASKMDPVAVVREITNGDLVDMAIEATGELDAINQIPHYIRERGHIALFGIGPAGLVDYAYMDLFRKHPNLISSSRTFEEEGYRSFKLAMDFIAQGRIDVRPLITHRLPFHSVAQAYDLATTRRDGVVKVMLDMGA